MSNDRKINNNNETQDYVYGKNPVIEYIRSKKPVNKVLIMKGLHPSTYSQIIREAKKQNVEVRTVKASHINSIAPKSVHQGVVAYVSPSSFCSIDDIIKKAEDKNENPFLIVLDKLTDSRNVGAIIRSAEAAGAHGIITAKRRAAPINATTAKASAGALSKMLVARVTNIAVTVDKLKEKGIWVTGTDINASMPYYECDFNCPMALVIGNEGKGVSRLVLEKCDFISNIPMKGSINSLNVSVAAGIFMFEVLKQRNK